ncbi:MAG: hypothetical protein C5B49_15970 [Bdellovibrio sp.]|nr:MAG: hypothetical protein C5B49_15970 [Bdellovibrio sp.]
MELALASPDRDAIRAFFSELKAPGRVESFLGIPNFDQILDHLLAKALSRLDFRLPDPKIVHSLFQSAIAKVRESQSSNLFISNLQRSLALAQLVNFYFHAAGDSSNEFASRRQVGSISGELRSLGAPLWQLIGAAEKRILPTVPVPYWRSFDDVKEGIPAPLLLLYGVNKDSPVPTHPLQLQSESLDLRRAAKRMTPDDALAVHYFLADPRTSSDPDRIEKQLLDIFAPRGLSSIFPLLSFPDLVRLGLGLLSYFDSEHSEQKTNYATKSALAILAQLQPNPDEGKTIQFLNRLTWIVEENPQGLESYFFVLAESPVLKTFLKAPEFYTIFRRALYSFKAETDARRALSSFKSESEFDAGSLGPKLSFLKTIDILLDNAIDLNLEFWMDKENEPSARRRHLQVAVELAKLGQGYFSQVSPKSSLAGSFARKAESYSQDLLR